MSEFRCGAPTVDVGSRTFAHLCMGLDWDMETEDAVIADGGLRQPKEEDRYNVLCARSQPNKLRTMPSW
jgi:hypothetical protein